MMSWSSNGCKINESPDILGLHSIQVTNNLFLYIEEMIHGKEKQEQEVSKSKIYWRIGEALYGELMLQQMKTATRSLQVVEVLHA
jgi:hypothetical protein